MNRKALIVSLVLISLLIGCQTQHYRVNSEAVPVDSLEVHKQDKADIPARIQVVNFVVNSVDADYYEEDKAVFRRHNALAIPNALHKSLGDRKAFSEVRRTELPEPKLADYVVSGTYDFADNRENGLFTHSITVKGTLHVRVARTRDNTQILDRDFVEDRTDTGRKNVALHVNYLQGAFIESITAEIKRCIAQDLNIPSATAR